MSALRDGGIALGRGRWFHSTLTELSTFWWCANVPHKTFQGKDIGEKETWACPALRILRSSVSELVDESDLFYAQTNRAWAHHTPPKWPPKIHHRNLPHSNSIASQKPHPQRWNKSQSLKQKKCSLLISTSVHFFQVFLIIFSLVSFSITLSLLFCLCNIIHWAPPRLLPASMHNTFQLCNYAIVIKSLRFTLNMY